MALRICATCARHFRHEERCPFCRVPQVHAHRRLAHAALVASMGIVVVGDAACDRLNRSSTADAEISAVAVYGGPPPSKGQLMRDDAVTHCDSKDYKRCLDLLDGAEKEDPGGESASPRAAEARTLAMQALGRTDAGRR